MEKGTTFPCSQYAFATLDLEGLSLIHGYSDPRFGTKNSQVRDIRLIPNAMLRNEFPQSRICEELYFVCMKHNLQLHPKEEEDSWLGEDRFPSPSMIYFPLSHTIMMWCVWNWVFHSNPLRFTIILKLYFNVFTSFIWSNGLDNFSWNYSQSKL